MTVCLCAPPPAPPPPTRFFYHRSRPLRYARALLSRNATPAVHCDATGGDTHRKKGESSRRRAWASERLIQSSARSKRNAPTGKNERLPGAKERAEFFFPSFCLSLTLATFPIDFSISFSFFRATFFMPMANDSASPATGGLASTSRYAGRIRED